MRIQPEGVQSANGFVYVYEKDTRRTAVEQVRVYALNKVCSFGGIVKAAIDEDDAMWIRRKDRGQRCKGFGGR